MGTRSDLSVRDFRAEFNEGNEMKSVSLVLMSLMAFTGSVYAAEPEVPNMLGTWKAISGVYAKTGTESTKIAPVFSQKPLQIELRVIEQKGRLFRGLVKGSSGIDLHLAGVIAKDGKSFTTSVDKGISTGTFESGKIEYCGATIAHDYNLAFCSTLEKAK